MNGIYENDHYILDSFQLRYFHSLVETWSHQLIMRYDPGGVGSHENVLRGIAGEYCVGFHRYNTRPYWGRVQWTGYQSTLARGE